MNGMIRTTLVVACIAGLASCATTESAGYRAADAPAGQSKSAVNTEYVAAVEAMARRSGVEVHWVNTPKKRVDRK